MSNKCGTCKKTVYFNEQVLVEGGGIYHEMCFKCSSCKRSLASGKEHVKEGVLFCHGCRPGQVEGFMGGTGGGGYGAAKYNPETGGSFISQRPQAEVIHTPAQLAKSPNKTPSKAGSFCSSCGAQASGNFCSTCGGKL
eukprot:gb/GEZN01018257.1/.p1 GENE.gb/GEZN01018257.1/~~gb/GEZN01018257.1/.p1  ORF type:complete len:138 (+),score=6.66 gb/GEZN01018257.1/:41-454(+)